MNAARVEQQEILDAFRAKHGYEPDEATVEFYRLPNGRILWHVRKMSARERENRDAIARRRELDAIAKSTQKVYVFGVYQKPNWLQRLLRLPSPPVVFFSERGAKEIARSDWAVVKIEVRA